MLRTRLAKAAAVIALALAAVPATTAWESATADTHTAAATVPATTAWE
ncbi:hypothetical protein [Kitasatospora azatica]|nr:hypothetical protein [Kitasatospora azatica]